MEDLDRHLTRDSLGQSESTTHTAPRPVQPFCAYDRRVALYFTMACSFSSSKLPLLMGDLDPHNTWFLGPNQVLNVNGILIGSAVLRGSLV